MTLPSLYVVGSAWVLSEICLSVLKRSKSNAVSKDRNTLGLIWTVNSVGMAIALFLAFTYRNWTLPWREQFYYVGIGIFAAGMVLRWYTIFYLGRFFTVNVAIAADHKLISTGPYRLLRHPSYSGALLMVLGFGLCLGNPASLVILVGANVSIILWRIQVEEAALRQAFGESYLAYQQKSKRLIPFVY